MEEKIKEMQKEIAQLRWYLDKILKEIHIKGDTLKWLIDNKYK